ncbi:MAG: hypothetical protein LBL83_07570 [Clostridiales bacterium]|nr:hypothetical protein [Clostridiales bacterium]
MNRIRKIRKTGVKNIKGKSAAVLACAALAVALGAAAAFAASAAGIGTSPPSLGAKSVNVAPSKDGLAMHVVKDGAHFYSVDGGETWNDAIPDGFTLDSRGNLEKIK